MNARLPYSPQTHPLGHVIEGAEFTVFFGNKDSSPEALATAFPDYRLVILSQTHSDLVIPSSESHVSQPRREADAHFSRDRKLALCIRTADCVPVLIHEPDSGLIAGIHAGWRGIENEIIRKTCTRLVAEGARLDKARAWIGPHIGPKSFEVGLDVAAKLEARFAGVRGHSDQATCLLPHGDPSKSFVDLLLIARSQLRAHGFEPEKIIDLSIDTVSSEDHASFRRDKEKAGRQISFIALK